MNAQPCHVSNQIDSEAAERGREEVREQAIANRTVQLKAEMWQHLPELSDAYSDTAATIGHYEGKRLGFIAPTNHPKAAEFLALIRDRSNDFELANILEKAMRDYISDEAGNRAEEELS